MNQNQFVLQNIMQIRERIYEILRKGAEGADPISLDRELSVLAVRLEAMPRSDVQPLVTLCDALRTHTNPASAQFITDPEELRYWCQKTRHSLIEDEAHNDWLESMRESAQDEINQTVANHNKKLRELTERYVGQFGHDEFIQSIIDVL